MTGKAHRTRRAATRAEHSEPQVFGAAFSRRVLILTLIGLIALLIVIAGLLVMRNNDLSNSAQRGPGPVPLFAIAGPRSGDAPFFVRPLGATWGPDGTIYVSDTGNRRVCVFSASGRFIREFGRTKRLAKSPYIYTLQQPAGLFASPDGDVYVADVRGGAVVVFDSKGKFLRRISPRLSAHSAPWTPTDVALYGGKLYVSDGKGVAVFSATGKVVRRFDSAYQGSPFAYPNGVAVRADGSVLISDTNNARVVALTSSGSLLWVLQPSQGTVRAVGLPRGLSVAPNGSILFADAFLFGVGTISPQGGYVGHYGSKGAELGDFQFPNDVAVRGDLVLVADKENGRVQVIRFPGLLVAPNSKP